MNDPAMAGNNDKPIAEMSFEEALAELDQVVGKLEGGQVPLEQSIALYERGDALKRHCEDRLADAELKVEKIVSQGDGSTKTEPFEGG